MMADADVARNEVTETGVKVAFCQDQLGSYFRFVPYRVTEIFRPRGRRLRASVDAVLQAVSSRG